MRRARPPLTDVVPRTRGASALKLAPAAADDMLVDRYAHTSDARRRGRA